MDEKEQHTHYVSIRGTQKDSLVVEAEWPGREARIPSGENGFGYDPLFIPEGETNSSRIIERRKNKISHRLKQ